MTPLVILFEASLPPSFPPLHLFFSLLVFFRARSFGLSSWSLEKVSCVPVCAALLIFSLEIREGLRGGEGGDAEPLDYVTKIRLLTSSQWLIADVVPWLRRWRYHLKTENGTSGRSLRKSNLGRHPMTHSCTFSPCGAALGGSSQGFLWSAGGGG